MSKDDDIKEDLTDVERRSFLKIIGGAFGGMLTLGATFPNKQAKHGHQLHKAAAVQRHHHHLNPRQQNTAAATLTRFVDALPIPPVISPTGVVAGVPLYTVTMRPFQQKLHRDLPPTPLWGYNSSYPGPTFDVRSGHPIAVDWKNDLPTRHFLPIDPTIHGAEPPTPQVRTVVHLHGQKVLPDSGRNLAHHQYNRRWAPDSYPPRAVSDYQSPAL